VHKSTPDFAFREVNVNEYGQPECVMLRIRPQDAKIDWRTLQPLPLDSWLRHGFAQAMSVWDEESQRWIEPGALPASELRMRLLPRAKRVGADRGSRQPLPDDPLETVPLVWTQAKNADGKTGLAVEKAFPGYPRRTLEDWVRHARDKGFIERSRQARRQKERKSDG
jgi:hypothetical protein